MTTISFPFHYLRFGGTSAASVVLDFRFLDGGKHFSYQDFTSHGTSQFCSNYVGIYHKTTSLNNNLLSLKNITNPYENPTTH